MPLVLPADRWDDWLDPGLTDAADVRALLEPPAPGLMRSFEVSAEVGNVRNNSADLVVPAGM